MAVLDGRHTVRSPGGRMMRVTGTRAAVERIAVLLLALLVSCAGRPARPVMVYQHGDEERSCDALERELQLIEQDIAALIPQADKTDRNTALGVTGIILLVPLFFMDLSKAEQIEINAYTKRYNHLLEISEQKDCGLDRQPIPELKPAGDD
jgi:hypothetical protein